MKDDEWWKDMGLAPGQRRKGSLSDLVQQYPAEFMLTICFVVGVLVLVVI